MIPTIDSSDAAAAREAGVRAASERGISACIAVVDSSGVLLELHRSDAAKAHAVDFATRKARSAALLGLETAVFERMVKEGRSLTGEVLALAGGVPIVHEGRCAGAVGVSGGSSDADHEIAVAAAKATLNEIADKRSDCG
jgi:glc operon protein GlcG